MDSRQSIRKQCRHLRRSLSAEQQTIESNKLLAQLLQLEKMTKAKRIALYLTNDGELSLSPFIHWCWQNQIQTYLPVVHPFSKGNLLFLHYHQASEMITNKYGIKEPKHSVQNVIPAQQLDIIFTPLVAFDTAGNRLGMGGGYYDRTLASWFKSKDTINKPYPIGLAHDCQQVQNIPAEHWDIPLPEIITPSQHHQFF